MKNGQKGSALMIVLWVVAIMSAAVLGLLQFLELGLSESATQSKNFRALQLAESGLALGMHPKIDKNDSHLREDLGHGESVAVTVKSEGARLNINSLLTVSRRPLLVDLLKKWKVKDREIDPLVDHLMDWVDEDSSERLNGGEKITYEKKGFPGFPPNRPFRSLEEMELVPGMAFLIKARPDWKKSFTVCGDGKLDINEAPAELIACVCQVGSMASEMLVERRLGPDGKPNTGDDFKYSSLAQVRSSLGIGEDEFREVEKRITLKSNYRRIASVGKVGNFRRVIEVVVRTGADAQSQPEANGESGQLKYLTWMEY